MRIVALRGHSEEQLPRRDSVTGLHEREAFIAQLRDATGYAARTARPMSLIVAAIDRFGQVTETAQPGSSEASVQIVVETITRTVQRFGMYTARLDLNEFGVILSATDEAAVWRVASNMVLAVRQQALPHPSGDGSTLTLSAGVATSNGHFDLDGTALWVVADQALHRARAACGDQVATSAVETADRGR